MRHDQGHPALSSNYSFISHNNDTDDSISTSQDCVSHRQHPGWFLVFLLLSFSHHNALYPTRPRSMDNLLFFSFLFFPQRRLRSPEGESNPSLVFPPSISKICRGISHYYFLLYFRLSYFCICCVIWALCSWKRSLTRCCVAIHLRTQRLRQPVSLEERDLEVKSSMQEVKQCSTRPPKA